MQGKYHSHCFSFKNSQEAVCHFEAKHVCGRGCEHICIKLHRNSTLIPSHQEDPATSPAASVSRSGLTLGKATNKINTKIGCKALWIPDLDLSLMSLHTSGKWPWLSGLQFLQFSRGTVSSQGHAGQSLQPPPSAAEQSRLRACPCATRFQEVQNAMGQRKSAQESELQT